MNPEIDLSGLRDLHILSKPSFWPLASGWWFLGITFIFILLFSILFYRFWRQRPLVYAIRKAKKICLDYPNDIDYLKALSQLLKRVAIATDGRSKIALLSDQHWQDFLLHRCEDVFSDSEAHLIAFAPYLLTVEKKVNRAIIQQHTFIWIKKVLKDKKSS